MRNKLNYFSQIQKNNKQNQEMTVNHKKPKKKQIKIKKKIQKKF